MLENILNEMKRLIAVHGLEVLQHYPDDLLVHDRAVLAKIAHAGFTIAWMVGHRHTHIVPLGIHEKENEMVRFLTNLSSEDRFYCIRVRHDGFSIAEKTREEFAALAETKICYQMQGVRENFWLLRSEQRIGHCTIERLGNICELKYKVTLTPLAEARAADIGVLEIWASKSVVSLAHSLFARSEVVWNEPLKMAA